MPPLETWINSTALAVMGAAILAHANAFIGLKRNISNRQYWIIAGFSLACTLLALYLNAAKEATIADQSFYIKNINNNVSSLIGSQATTKEMIAVIQTSVGAVATAGAENLQGLTNDQLRARVAALAVRLRDFDAKRNTAISKALFDDLPSPKMSEEARGILFHVTTQKVIEETNAYNTEFRKTLFPATVALRDELVRRNSNVEASAAAHFALESGMLAGPFPASSTADYLEALARSLT